MLVLSIDQGSEGWAPAMWMLYAQRMRLVVVHDPSHRCWNDLKASISESGLWDAILLWGVVFNVNYGPCDGGAWWRQAQEAAE